jgi:hypothetical protein
MTCNVRGAFRSEAFMLDGDKEFARVDGESMDESRLHCGWERAPRSKFFGLSLPVGPFPRGGRLAGGKFSSCRKQAFSSSSSETLCSKA